MRKNIINKEYNFQKKKVIIPKERNNNLPPETKEKADANPFIKRQMLAKNVLESYQVEINEIYKSIENWIKNDLKFRVHDKIKKQILKTYKENLDYVHFAKGVQTKIKEIETKEFYNLINVGEILTSNFNKNIVSKAVKKYAVEIWKNQFSHFPPNFSKTFKDSLLSNEGEKTEIRLRAIPSSLTELCLEILETYLDRSRKNLIKESEEKFMKKPSKITDAEWISKCYEPIKSISSEEGCTFNAAYGIWSRKKENRNFMIDMYRKKKVNNVLKYDDRFSDEWLLNEIRDLKTVYNKAKAYWKNELIKTNTGLRFTTPKQ